MNTDASSDKPRLKLIKKKIPTPSNPYGELEFDFGFDDTTIDHYPTVSDSTHSMKPNISFNELLDIQSECINRIQYYSDELEFNLD